MKHHISLIVLIMAFSGSFWSCNTSTGKNSQKQVQTPSSDKKILTLGGTVSEIVSALGLTKQIVATDRTSVYPESLQQLPSVGYRNSIKAEGVLATGAELILAETDYLNADVASQLQTAGIPFHATKNELNPESTKAMIREIAAVVGKQKQGEEVIQLLEEDIQKVDALLRKATSKPKVMFVYARGQGAMSVCGKETFAQSIVSLAGGQLATPEISGYKPLTPEALVAADPDYILFFDSGLESLGGIEGALAIQGVAETKAGKNKRIIAMDGLYLSGFGPRIGKAAYDLALLIHPELQSHTISHTTK